MTSEHVSKGAVREEKVGCEAILRDRISSAVQTHTKRGSVYPAEGKVVALKQSTFGALSTCEKCERHVREGLVLSLTANGRGGISSLMKCFVCCDITDDRLRVDRADQVKVKA